MQFRQRMERTKRIATSGISAECRFDGVDQLTAGERFQDVVMTARLQRCEPDLRVIDGAEEYDFRGGSRLANGRSRGDAVHVWQRHIHENEIDRYRSRFEDGLNAVVGHIDARQACVMEVSDEEGPPDGAVIDNKDSNL
jgi:hypothetical protein